jgi:spore coat polysaccharide biosynthesis predicted glycosyltransferase SpsG
MKLAKLSIGGIEFGTHMVSEDTWNGWSIPYINEKDMEEFVRRVYEFFNEISDSYDIIEKEFDMYVWNAYYIKGDKKILERTEKIAFFEEDGQTYYDIFCGHTWEHEEVA